MILKNVVDIDPQDLAIKELVKLTDLFGLSDFYEVALSAYSMINNNKKQVMFVVTDESASEIICTFLSMAALNYASWKHEVYEVEVPSGDSTALVAFNRSGTLEQHKQSADYYVSQAKTLIDKYFPTNPE